MGLRLKIGSTVIFLTKNLTLSSLFSVLLRQFLPDNNEKYATAQFRMTKAYRQYYSWVPEFLHQRQAAIAHSLQTVNNCEKEKYTDTDVQTLDAVEGKFSVKRANCYSKFWSCVSILCHIPTQKKDRIGTNFPRSMQIHPDYLLTRMYYSCLQFQMNPPILWNRSAY